LLSSRLALHDDFEPVVFRFPAMVTIELLGSVGSWGEEKRRETRGAPFLAQQNRPARYFEAILATTAQMGARPGRRASDCHSARSPLAVAAPSPPHPSSNPQTPLRPPQPVDGKTGSAQARKTKTRQDLIAPHDARQPPARLREKKHNRTRPKHKSPKPRSLVRDLPESQDPSLEPHYVKPQHTSHNCFNQRRHTNNKADDATSATDEETPHPTILHPTTCPTPTPQTCFNPFKPRTTPP